MDHDEIKELENSGQAADDPQGPPDNMVEVGPEQFFTIIGRLTVEKETAQGELGRLYNENAVLKNQVASLTRQINIKSVKE